MANVYGLINRDNDYINECNNYFYKKIEADKIISLEKLNDSYGWLDKKYTDDGLHLNLLGYQKFKTIIEEGIKGEI